MINIIRNGLSQTKSPKQIIVVGAGMAGLVAASLLKEAGHQITMLEANQRVGGRIYTIRASFSEGLYFNAGPMRIPEGHALTMEYIRKFKLPTNLFLNQTSNDILYVNGIWTRQRDYDFNPNILKYPVASHEKGKTAESMMLAIIKPLLHFINQNPDRNWHLIEQHYNNHSLGNILNYYLSTGAIDMIGVLLDMEAYMGMSFVEVLRESVIFAAPTRYVEIIGGMDQLPYAFLPQLRENIQFNHKITEITQSPGHLTIHSMHEHTLEHVATTGQIAIITIPFSALRFVNFQPNDTLSYKKRKTIREINYLASTKIAIEFKSRFWERVGQFGGKSITDLPIRFTYYPSYGMGKAGHAVVLASYTWADEALTWDSLSEKDRIRYSLRNLAQIYGDLVYAEFVSGASFSWGQNPYSCGAFTALEPGQELELYPDIAIPEGNIYFAGEHTTLTHGWIQGAIESGVRAAYEISKSIR